jgi:hypothetical protein
MKRRTLLKAAGQGTASLGLIGVARGFNDDPELSEDAKRALEEAYTEYNDPEKAQTALNKYGANLNDELVNRGILNSKLEVEKITSGTKFTETGVGTVVNSVIENGVATAKIDVGKRIRGQDIRVRVYPHTHRAVATIRELPNGNARNSDSEKLENPNTKILRERDNLSESAFSALSGGPDGDIIEIEACVAATICQATGGNIPGCEKFYVYCESTITGCELGDALFDACGNCYQTCYDVCSC